MHQLAIIWELFLIPRWRASRCVAEGMSGLLFTMVCGRTSKHSDLGLETGDNARELALPIAMETTFVFSGTVLVFIICLAGRESKP